LFGIRQHGKKGILAPALVDSFSMGCFFSFSSRVSGQ
jgi:hypothetical protein